MRQPPRPHKGVFVTFEGVDGAGKTTQLRALGIWLRQKGVKVVETREPGGTPAAERIRDVLLDPENRGLSARSELFLILASRAEHVEKHVRPALLAGQTVLCDRFTDATFAYQGDGRGFPADMLTKATAFASDGLVPDLTFLLDVDPTVGRKRITARTAPSDRFESEKADFYLRVRDAYQKIAKRDSGRVVTIEASGSMAIIQEKIRQAMTQRGFANP